MKNKFKIIWFIFKYGYEKFFFKNFKMYAPSVAGSEKTKGKITLENINFIFPMISLLISRLPYKEKFFDSRSFCKNRSRLKDANKLKKLFNFYGSDKSRYHNYHYIYSSIFKNPLKVKKILEIGIGTNNTKTTLENAFIFREYCHAFMVTVPYYNKPSQEGIYQHFATIAQLIADKSIMKDLNLICNKSKSLTMGLMLAY